jgi:hypothetical protein
MVAAAVGTVSRDSASRDAVSVDAVSVDAVSIGAVSIGAASVVAVSIGSVAVPVSVRSDSFWLLMVLPLRLGDGGSGRVWAAVRRAPDL